MESPCKRTWKSKPPLKTTYFLVCGFFYACKAAGAFYLEVCMKIKNIGMKQVDWKRYTKNRSKFQPIYEKIRKMRLNTAIEVILDEPCDHLHSVLQGNLRSKRVKDYRLMCRKLSVDFKKWAIAKVNQ